MQRLYATRASYVGVTELILPVNRLSGLLNLRPRPWCPGKQVQPSESEMEMLDVTAATPCRPAQPTRQGWGPEPLSPQVQEV